MGKITLGQLKENAGKKNTYEAELTINGINLSISLDPDDIEIEKTIVLANKILGDFEFHEGKARKRIVDDFLDNYNLNWRDELEEEPALNAEEFSENLVLQHISFMSDSSIDFFYSENGMFGDHTLIAQSFDGENFEGSMMFG